MTFTPELRLQQPAEVGFQNGASVVGDGADSVDALRAHGASDAFFDDEENVVQHQR